MRRCSWNLRKTRNQSGAYQTRLMKQERLNQLLCSSDTEHSDSRSQGDEDVQRTIPSQEQQEHKGRNSEGSVLENCRIWWDSQPSGTQRSVLVTLTISQSLFQLISAVNHKKHLWKWRKSTQSAWTVGFFHLWQSLYLGISLCFEVTPHLG